MTRWINYQAKCWMVKPSSNSTTPTASLRI
ncbi:Uncharacterised protein [Vibrio cholerae]|nr:Uncharacterised protein [Vibrio cholerae]